MQRFLQGQEKFKGIFLSSDGAQKEGLLFVCSHYMSQLAEHFLNICIQQNLTVCSRVKGNLLEWVLPDCCFIPIDVGPFNGLMEAVVVTQDHTITRRKEEKEIDCITRQKILSFSTDSPTGTCLLLLCMKVRYWKGCWWQEWDRAGVFLVKLVMKAILGI